ncbi:MAG: hypothetical protein HY598_04410 [Candidatus Omnitrophica bacterium]|nr:hypothetical protein [Candidatus Omnitrophota bacterium]
MKRMDGVVVAALMLIGTQPAWAMRTRAHEMAESPRYGQKAGGMLGRGVINASTCFVDPLVHIVNETKAGPPLIGTLTGIASGVGCGALRLGSGAVDLITFWVPGFNGFPVADSYENCLTTGGAMAASPASQELPPGYAQPASSAWEVPTGEPGAAQVPQPAQAQAPKPKKTWTK